MDFVSELVRKRGKENLQKFVLFIVEIFKRYEAASTDFKPYRQKDGALLAIGALCDKLKQTEPYKSELEPMLVQHVFPEFANLVGHLRAKIWLGGTPAQTSLARTFTNKVKIHDLEKVFEPLFYSWRLKRKSKESFSDFTNHMVLSRF